MEGEKTETLHLTREQVDEALSEYVSRGRPDLSVRSLTMLGNEKGRKGRGVVLGGYRARVVALMISVEEGS